MGDERVDFETILRKYLAHVRASEGVDYVLDGTEDRDSRAAFTDVEWAELERVATELSNDRRREHAAWLASHPRHA